MYNQLPYMPFRKRKTPLQIALSMSKRAGRAAYKEYRNKRDKGAIEINLNNNK